MASDCVPAPELRIESIHTLPRLEGCARRQGHVSAKRLFMFTAVVASQSDPKESVHEYHRSQR
jgi:hypothetical protein